MPEDFRKFAEKIGVYVAPGGKADIGTQIIEAQRKLTPTKVIPYRSSTHFVGRENELSLLYEKLQRGDYVAVAGMGGVGKTELATQYARRNEDKYGGIAWFNARETNLTGEVLQFFWLQFEYEIPQELGGRQLSLKEQVSWCWSKYPDSPLPILIVFDDITDLANFREVFPIDDRFRVLITTRLRNLDPSFIQEISLDVLSPKKTLELLQQLLGEKDRRIYDEPEAAAAICKFLEYLPLGIELVGGYLKEDLDLSLNHMFERLEDRKLAHKALQGRENLSSSQLGVKAAFTLTWLQLDPLTQQLGKLLSLFSSESILWKLVIWVATKGEEKGDDKESLEKQLQLTWTDEELNEAKKQLYKRNLLQALEEKQGYYKIHSLVRWFLQDYLAEENEIKSILSRTFATAMISVARNIPELFTYKDIEFYADLISHLEDLARRLIAEMRQTRETQIISLASVPNEQVRLVFWGVQSFYFGQGLYQLAEPWFKDCVEVCKALFSGDHPDVALSLNNLGRFYDSQGRYSEAEPLLTEALAIYKRLFDGDHTHLVAILNNLAYLYSKQGRNSEAEPLLTEALAIYKRLFNGDHPDVALSLNDLGAVYYAQGRKSEAEPFFTEALAMYKRLFNGDHPYVTLSLNNFAELYNNQGRKSEAEPLASKKLLLDGDHIDKLSGLLTLGGLLHRFKERHSEAEPLLTEALAMTKRLCNGDHPYVALSLNDLGYLYYNQRRYSEAEPLFTEALAMYKRLFNSDHPDVALSLNNLAELYHYQERHSEVEPFLTEALAMRKRLFNGDHQRIAQSLNNLAEPY